MSAEPAYWEQLSQAYRPALVSYFMRRTANHAEAEDLTHEVFLRLAKTDLDRIATREAYIFQTAANLLRDRARREKVRLGHAEDSLRQHEYGLDLLDPHRVAEGQNLLDTIYAALPDLPEITRHIFLLYRMENVDKRLIAERFAVTIRTVDKHIARATAYLSQRIGGWP